MQPVPAYNRLRPCRHGTLLYNFHDTYIGRSLDLYGEFSEGEVELFEQVLRPGQTVVEVGANIGAHTVALAQLVGAAGQVLAFEPQRLLYQTLCANLALNSIPNVRCWLAAVGRAPGEVLVPALDHHRANNFGGLSLEGHVHGERVPMLTIDSLGLPACHLLKVDVEGMEEAVLAGAAATIARCKPLLYVEKDSEEKSAALVRAVAGLGYDPYWHLPSVFNPSNFAGNPENAFGAIISKNMLCVPRGTAVRVRDLKRVEVPVFGGDKATEAPPSYSVPAPSCPPARLAEARRTHQGGDLAGAVPLYRAALRDNPDDAQGWYLLGATCEALAELGEAHDALRRSLDIRPDHAAAQNHLGVVLIRQGRMAEAADHFREALRLQPDHAEAGRNLARALTEGAPRTAADAAAEECIGRGLALLKQRSWAEAESCFRQSLVLRPDFAEAHHNLGLVLWNQGRYTEAEASSRTAVRLRPDMTQAHNNLGAALKAQGRFEEAAEVLREAVRLAPDMAQAHNNLGIALNGLGRLDEAEACYREARRLQPTMAEAHNNLANVLRERVLFDEELAGYEEALRLQPDYVDAHWNRALWWLSHGDFERGWPEYEWRWRLAHFGKHSYQNPQWDGGSLAGRTILLHAEQGLGDTIHFVRYAPLVKARGGRVVLVCQPPLVRLLAGCPGVDRLLAQGDTLPPFDVHAPLLSLPGIFKTDAGSIPARVPYLQAEPDRVRRWRQKLNELPGRKVGIAWQGSKAFRGDRYRSVPLAYFAPLGRVPGVTLVSLQKGPGTEQLRQAPFAVAELPELDEAGPFVDTAAVLRCLDLVVCTDTAVPHLAGALAVPCWLALGAAPDWRWLLDRDDSPWYPTLRLFRQTQPGDWEEVFQRIVGELMARMRSNPISP